MTTTTDRAVLGVWTLLITATVVSVALSDNAMSRTGTIAILSIAFAKVYLVGLYFMELRDAPRPLRYVVAAWCIATWAALTGIYVGVC